MAQTPDGHDVRANLEALINGFSQNVRDIFEKFGFLATIDHAELLGDPGGGHSPTFPGKSPRQAAT